MATRQLRCTSCFSIQDVQLARHVFEQEDGMRDGHYFVVYAHDTLRPYCAPCRHRLAAFERLIGIRQRRGEDVAWWEDEMRKLYQKRHESATNERG